MAQGDENLAEQCLARAMTEEDGANTLGSQVATLEEQVAQLRTQVERYRNRIAEAEREKKVLVARKRIADSSQRIQGTMSKLSTSANAFSVLERLKERVTESEARVVAEKQLAGDTEALEEKVKALGTKTGLQERMAALRGKMGQAKALPCSPEDQKE